MLNIVAIVLLLGIIVFQFISIWRYKNNDTELVNEITNYSTRVQVLEKEITEIGLQNKKDLVNQQKNYESIIKSNDNSFENTKAEFRAKNEEYQRMISELKITHKREIESIEAAYKEQLINQESLIEKLQTTTEKKVRKPRSKKVEK
jgi:hypothetical protein